MGLSELMGKEVARRAALAKEAEQAFDARLRAASLPSRCDRDFKGTQPITNDGWNLYRCLLEQEGDLTPIKLEEIRRGLEAVRIDEEIAVRRKSIGNKADPFERWNAIVSLGLDGDTYYKTEYEKARRAAEGAKLRQRVEEISARVKFGESLPDPEMPDGFLIPPKLAFIGHGAVIEWIAIKELGWDRDPFYRRAREAAEQALSEISRRRGDFERILAEHRKPVIPSDPESQQPTLPPEYLEVELFVPFVALRTPKKSFLVIRYHPEFGLVRGRVSEDSYYDRGAGSYPGSRGSRIKEYLPQVNLFLEDVDFRKCQGLTKVSVWRVTGDPPVVIGRNKSTVATRNAFHYGRKFDSQGEAYEFLVGSIESEFVRETLPVAIENCESSWRLRFHGRPLL